MSDHDMAMSYVVDAEQRHSPGPWQMATSCSFRRIIDASGREIIGGTVQRSDNHPDLYFANGGFEGPDAKLVLAAPELLEALKLADQRLSGIQQYSSCKTARDEAALTRLAINAAIAKAVS